MMLKVIYIPGSSKIAGWKIHHEWVDVFPIENGDILASYVSLPEDKSNFPNLLQLVGGNFPASVLQMVVALEEPLKC